MHHYYAEPFIVLYIFVAPNNTVIVVLSCTWIYIKNDEVYTWQDPIFLHVCTGTPEIPGIAAHNGRTCPGCKGQSILVHCTNYNSTSPPWVMCTDVENMKPGTGWYQEGNWQSRIYRKCSGFSLFLIFFEEEKKWQICFANRTDK